jgi:hypothetical protein
MVVIPWLGYRSYPCSGKAPVRVFVDLDFKSRSGRGKNSASKKVPSDYIPTLEDQLKVAEETLMDIGREIDFARRQETLLRQAGGTILHIPSYRRTLLWHSSYQNGPSHVFNGSVPSRFWSWWSQAYGNWFIYENFSRIRKCCNNVRRRYHSKSKSRTMYMYLVLVTKSLALVSVLRSSLFYMIIKYTSRICRWFGWISS